MIKLVENQKPDLRKALSEEVVSFRRTKILKIIRLKHIVSAFFKAALYTAIMAGIVQEPIYIMYGVVGTLLFLLELIYTGIDRWHSLDSRYQVEIDMRRAKVIDKHLRGAGYKLAAYRPWIDKEMLEYTVQIPEGYIILNKNDGQVVGHIQEASGPKKETQIPALTIV